MNGINTLTLFGILTAVLLTWATPANAQAPVIPDAAPIIVPAEDTEYVEDVAALTELTNGGRRAGKPSLRQMLRHPGREWPRLLIRYAQPAMRGLLLDRHNHSGNLALNTTFFRNDSKGMKLIGGVGRTGWGDREARMQFTLRF